MNYKVWQGKRGKIFGSLKEASAYANEHARKTHEILCVTETKAKITHVYALEENA